MDGKDRKEVPVGVEAGFPGTWFIENRSLQAQSEPAGRLTASYLRFLRTASVALASRYPGRRVWGRVLVSDLPGGDGSLCVSFSEDKEVEALLEIPSRRLFEKPETQAGAMARMSASRTSPQLHKDLQEPTATAPSGRTRGLVQFIHCASLFESRERRFSSVPPAAFFMAPALQREGFQVAVDSLLLEPFAEPGLTPERIREADRESLDRILERRPFCIALTAMDFYLEELRCLLREIRTRDKEVLIALGGPLVTLYPEKAPVYIEEGNIFIRGEADLAFGEVLACLGPLGADRPLSPGQVSLLKGKEGLFLRSGGTVLVANLDRRNRVDSLDAVFREALDLGFIRKQHVSGGLHLHTTRGCPFRCSFCIKVHGSHVRAMRSETIFRLLSAYRERIEEIRRTEGLTEQEMRQAFQVSLSDDDFLLARSRAAALFHGLSGHPFRLKSVPAGIPSLLSRGEDNRRVFDPELFDAVKAAGPRIRSFEIGTDDFSERELLRLAKGHPAGYTLGDIEEVLRGFERLKIENRHFVILSNPDTLWSDLFDKLATLEAWSWSYPHFYPDPNPFVLAPVGTPLFSLLARQGRAETLSGRVLTVPGFPEFTHRVFNMAPPREDLFSTERLSGPGFFKRLADLLKGGHRLSIFDDAYLHFLDVCGRANDSLLGAPDEAERTLDRILRAVRARVERIDSGLKAGSFPSSGSKAAGRIHSLANMLSGMFLVCETVGGLFPGTAFEDKREELCSLLDGFFDRMENSPDVRTGLPEIVRQSLERALRFGRAQVVLYRAGGCEDRARPIAESFATEFEVRLLDLGLRREAEEWSRLTARGARLVGLEVADDRGDATFVEDPARTGRLFELLGLAGPPLDRPEEDLRFLRAELVFRRSIHDDFLGHPETRIPLYDGLAGLPLDFCHRFQQEFGVSAFLDKDEFIAGLLSRFLVARELPHDRAVHGTFLFDGLEGVLQGLVPPSLTEFSRWFFGRDACP